MKPIKTTIITATLLTSLIFINLFTNSLHFLQTNISSSFSLPLYNNNTTRAQYNWLIMVYDDGDNSLTDFIQEDINEMTAGGSKPNEIAFLVLADFGYDRRAVFDDLLDINNMTRDLTNTSQNTSFIEAYNRAILTNNKPAHLYWVQHGSLKELSLEEAGIPQEPNMADPNTLIKFLNYGLTNYPASHTMLVLADHGLSFNGFMQDEYSNDYMTPSKLHYALQSVNYRFDIIGFDACLMASMSMLYEVAPFTDYIIASELTEPAKGWDYTVFSELYNNPSLEPLDLANEIITAYHNQYPSTEHTIAIYDAKKFIQATLVFDDFINSLLPYAGHFTPLLKTLKNNPTYGIPEIYYFSYIYDIITFLNTLKSYLEDNPIPVIDPSTAIPTVNTALLNSIIQFYSLTTDLNVNGISLFVPDHYTASINFLSTLFTKHTQWNEFLYATFIDPSYYKRNMPPQPNIYIDDNSALHIEIPQNFPDNFKKYTISQKGIGNTVYSVMASVNGYPLSNGYFAVSEATIYARTYDGYLYSPLIAHTYKNINGVYIQAPSKSLTYYLQEGWNLLAIPFIPSQIRASDLINTYYGVDNVMYRDPTQQGVYIVYNSEMPSTADFELKAGQVYYVHATSQTVIELEGFPIPTPTITLYVGWNLVPIYYNMSALNLYQLSDGAIKSIYDPSQSKIFVSQEPTLTNFNLHYGQGVWIYATEERTILLQQNS